MTSGLFDPHGGADPTLTGVESRTLRALLQLERRHIAILAETVSNERVTTERVTQWERSADRGYPGGLVTLLRDIEGAVSDLAGQMAGQARRDREGRMTILRPRSKDAIMARLRLAEAAEVRFSPDQLKALDEGGGDFWQRLCDAAVASAALSLGFSDNRPVHVAYEAEST